MATLQWDKTGERKFETGVDRGVLYVYDESKNEYKAGVAWNGLTTVTKSPEGAEPNPIYADNIKYVNMTSEEEVNGTIEAFTYPPEFEICDGSVSPIKGVSVGQQSRTMFAMAYRSRVGNDVVGDSLGHKIHIIWGMKAAPSEKSYATVNDSPEAITFSWEFSTTKIPFKADGTYKDLKPTAALTFDSTEMSEDQWSALEAAIYDDAKKLPLPEALLTALAGAGAGAVPGVGG